MDKKVYITLSAILISIILIVTIVFIFVPKVLVLDFGERKAIILCSANDFYGSEVEENFGFDGGEQNWTFNGGLPHGYEPTVGNKELGSIFIEVGSSEFYNVNYTYNWTKYNQIKEESIYNLSTWIFFDTPNDILGLGTRIGLNWLNSNGETVRLDWSENINSTIGGWKNISIMSLYNNDSENEITGLELVLSFEGNFSAGTDNKVYFDDVIVDRWVAVNVTNPFDPNNRRKDSDGFPAQALQVYKVLKRHGYTDKNIFLMLYHTNDPTIDIDAFDGISNDTADAIVDVENDDVNATRFKRELNVSIAGSFASNISIYDQLIIFMTDHGSNKLLGDGNATFHFEADGSRISETEFYDLVKNINCLRMMINVDCCFSGNFLNEKKPIGSSWYDIDNCLFVSSSADRLSWYWIDNKNPDGWAGSWFFHVFWDQLDQNQTIFNAFNSASGFIPAGQAVPLALTQIPLMYDNLGINNTWGFNSINKL
ncbi:MAG: C13 family peptidase [Promethearchaeati archaeon]